MNFVDSNILAYAFYENENKEKCKNCILEGGITDSLALVEAFNIIEYQTNRKNAVDSIKSLLKSNLEIVNIDENVIFQSLKRAGKYNLEFLDLVHYIVALVYNCKNILTYDKDFDNLELKRVEP